MSFKQKLMLLALCLAVIFLVFIQSKETKAVFSPQDSVKLPIIMYHSLLKDTRFSGDYVITPALLEQDLLYIQKKGYTAITTKQLSQFTLYGGNLPEKPILITFDDGYYNNYLYAYPIAKKLKIPIVISPIARLTEDFSKTKETNANWAHMSDLHLAEMYASGLVEFQNHSFDLHKQAPRKGISRLKNESTEAYQRLLAQDLEKAQLVFENSLVPRPDFFTYPFGVYSQKTEEIIKQLDFIGSFTCEQRVNVITREPDCLYALGRYNRPSSISTEAFFSKILTD